MSPDIPFAELIKRRRITLGMNHASLAELVGRSASAVRSWERGAATPTNENVIRSLAAVLGVEETILRDAVGLPPDIPFEGPDEVGGDSLAAFAEEDDRLDQLSASEEPPGDLLLSDDDEYGHPIISSAEEPEAGVDIEVEATTTQEEPEFPPAFVGEEPGDGTAEPPDAPVASPGIERVGLVEPVRPMTAAVTSPTVALPAEVKPVQPAERSYLDDPDQMMTYWIRAALTVAFAVFLVIVLFWALGRLGDSIGEVWEIFKAGA